MDVEHTGNTIETETIELVLIHPESKVAQQKSKNLMVSIVEQPAVPLVMTTLATTMEVLVISTIKLVETIQDVLRGVTVNHIEQNNKAQTVSGVDEFLQILRGSISAARREEVVDLVSEAGIVRVLHHSHELNDIVTEILDPGKHVLGELLVRSHPLVGSRDTDVSLIDTETGGLCWALVLKLILLRGRRVPEASIVGWRHRKVLGNILDPSR